MPTTREAIKCSLLQQKTTRRTGTLRRKKKTEYGETCWVVLCVHDDKIPILEWYHCEDAVNLHQPFKVLDLLFANYVSDVVSDSRAFIIGLKDLEPIELVALLPEVCSEWVNCLTETLRRLSILGDTTNIYGVTPKKCDLTETPTLLGTPISLHVEMSAEAPPRHNVLPHDPHCLNRTSQIHSPHLLRPPLPPRSHQIFPSRPHTVVGDEKHEETPYDVLNAQSRVSCDNEKESDWYDSPRRFYDTLSPGASLSNISSSPLESTLSTTSLCSSLSSELRLSTSIPSEEIVTNDYDTLRSEADHSVRSVVLNLSVLIEHVMFVEVAGRVWVAGWSEVKNPQLSLMFNVGDELIEVEKIPVQGFANVTQLFYSLSTPGTPLNLRLRRIPLGMTYHLMKPISKNKELGIRLHKNKNRIAAILPDSLAHRRQVPVSMPSFLKPEVNTAVVITEVNKRRLNPFCKNGQLFKRLDEIRDGSEFDIVLHPHDFIKLMKQQIVKVHHYKAFLCHT